MLIMVKHNISLHSVQLIKYSGKFVRFKFNQPEMNTKYPQNKI